ncbi:MAG: hypothetical protein K8T20_19245 [Planctomycetes bacterium]|nr:hypothetical protein [Planctomycetota bacterium]
MAKSCGFELTPTTLRAVVVDGTIKAWRMLAYYEQEVPAPAEGQDPKESYTQAVVKFVVENGLPRGTVVPSVSAAGATIREVVLPFGSDEQLRKTVKFELESHSHSIDVDLVVVDFVKVDHKEKQAYLLAFAAEKKDVRARLEQMSAARIDPPSIDLDATAALNALLNSGGDSATEAFVALYATRHGTYLYHYSGGLKLVRALPLGSAEAGFESKAAAEVGRTLLRVSGGHDLPPVLVCGDADNLPGLAAQIARETGVEATAVDLMPEGLAIERAEQARRAGGVALGLALKGIGLDRVGIDLRREEFTYERKTDQLKRAVAMLLLMVNIFLALWAYKAWTDRGAVQLRQNELMALERKMWKDVFPEEKEPVKPLEAFRSRKAEWQESQGGGGHPVPISALMYWAMLFGKIQVQSKFFISALTVSAAPGQASIKMSGTADPAPEVERIWTAIRSEKAFANAKAPATSQDKTMWRWDMDIPIVPEETGK